MIKLHKHIILDPKPYLCRNHPKMEWITSCITSKNSIEFSNLSPPLFFVIDEIRTNLMSNKIPQPEKLIQATTSTRTHSKDKLMLRFQDRKKVIYTDLRGVGIGITVTI